MPTNPRCRGRTELAAALAIRGDSRWSSETGCRGISGHGREVIFITALGQRQRRGLARPLGTAGNRATKAHGWVAERVDDRASAM